MRLAIYNAELEHGQIVPVVATGEVDARNRLERWIETHPENTVVTGKIVSVRFVRFGSRLH